MKRNKFNSEDNFLKYLAISVVIHGVILFVLTQAGFGTQSLSRQPQNYQEIQLVQTEEFDPTATNLEKEGEKPKEAGPQDKEGTKASKAENDEEETVSEPQEEETETEEKVDNKKETQEQADTQNQEGTQKTEEESKQTAQLETEKEQEAQKQEQEKETTSKQVEETEEPEQEKSDEMLTSEQSEEEVKVAEENKEEGQKEQAEEEQEKEQSADSATQEETSDQKTEESNEETGEEGKEETEQESEEKPPPTPQSLIAKKITPSYPKDASNDAVEGDVKLAVYVDGQGQIKRIEILKEAEDERLTNIAYLTVERGWQFKGGQGDYRITMLVNFKIVDHQHQVNVEFVDLSFVKE